MTKPSGRPRAQEPFPVSGPVDILAFIPHSLGFSPQESLVLMTMDSSRLGATLRLDLPSGAVDYSDFSLRVTELLRSDSSANGVLMAVYTNRRWKTPGIPPYRKLVDQLGRHLEEAGLPIRDGWLVSGSAWREYFCTDATCCPWPGHPLGEITDSTLSAEMVYRGSAYARSLHEAVILDLPAAWDNSGDAVLHQQRYTLRLTGCWCSRSQFTGTLAVWDELFTRAAGAAHGSVPDSVASDFSVSGSSLVADSPEADPSGCSQCGAGPGCPELRAHPELAGFLLASLHARPVRDTLVVMAALGLRKALDGAADCNLLSAGEESPVLPPGAGVQAESWPLAGRDGHTSGPPDEVPAAARDGRSRRTPAPDAGRDFRDVLIGQYAGRPDWAALDAAFAVFAELLGATAGGTASETDDEAAAALLSLLAWIEWARGRGSRAQVYLLRCLDAYPGYRLAELLDELLATGMFPVWARTAGTAWRAASERRPGPARA